MKRVTLLTALLISAVSLRVSAAQSEGITLGEGNINVDMTLDLRQMKVRSEQAVVYTPMLVNGSDTVTLPSVGVFGRSRYIRHERGNDNSMDMPREIFRASKAPSDYGYHAETPYSPRLEGASLMVRRRIYGCASCSKGTDIEETGIAVATKPQPDLTDAFMIAAAEADTVKIREISGRANVEFPVNRTVLLTDFRKNAAELAKVRASIDSVRNDRDVSIKKMKITGYASPEGSFANNERLASGRTKALCDYVADYYSFPQSLLSPAWVPEDWEGLREWVKSCDFDVRDGLLEIIDDTAMSPDARDALLKKRYPLEYAFMLKNIYPSLRHTDYRIEYVIKTYSNPSEILEVMRTRPDHLSLDEFYLATRGMDPASDIYAEVMETAVRTYPDDPTANMNAANAALRRGDTETAARYLAKAGNSAEAVHSRGILALINGDADEAVVLLRKSADAGVPQSKGMLEQALKLQNYNRAVK